MILTARNLMLVGFLIRLLVAFWNGFFDFEFGQISDAGSFHNRARFFAGFCEDEYGKAYISPAFAWEECLVHVKGRGSFFTCFLAKIYYWTNIDSLFISSAFSCTAWLMSASVLLKIMGLLSIDKSSQFKAMVVYALLPSSLLITSITLREPYELLLINVAVFAVLKIYESKSYRYLPVLILSVVLFSLLHKALMVVGLLIVLSLVGMYIFRRNRKGYSSARFMLIAPIIALFLIFGASKVRGGVFDLLSNSFADAARNLGEEIEKYQKGGLAIEARAHYKTDVEINGIMDLLIFVPVGLFQYLFEPMPWRVSAITDVMLLLENLLRMWLIWKAWFGIHKIPIEKRRLVRSIFLLYFMTEGLWSLGTINWGTAMRHHIPAFGLLVVSAFAYSARMAGRTKILTPVNIGINDPRRKRRGIKP